MSTLIQRLRDPHDRCWHITGYEPCCCGDTNCPSDGEGWPIWCHKPITKPRFVLFGTCTEHTIPPLWARALIWAFKPVGRWIEWDGQCGRPLDAWLNGLRFNCANPVGRIAYTLFGRCLRRH